MKDRLGYGLYSCAGIRGWVGPGLGRVGGVGVVNVYRAVSQCWPVLTYEVITVFLSVLCQF